MVLPISGFLPVPLPMMIPFMGAQSLVIGKMFGEGFQYGKRKISAMPNEEFNKLTFESLMSNARDEMQASIPTMQKAMQDMKPMVETVVHEFTNYLRLVIDAAPEQAGQIVEQIRETSGFNKANQSLVDLIKQAGIDIDEFWKAAGLPAGPVSAFATDMPTTVGVDLTKPSTVKGLTIGEAQQRARDIQKQHEKQIAEQRRLRIKLKGTPVFQKPRGFGRKRRAGQSQKFERIKLVKHIAMSIANQSRTTNKEQRRKNVITVQRLQQRLVNLLSRYSF